MLWLICIQLALLLWQGVRQISADFGLPKLPITDSSFTLSTRLTVHSSLSGVNKVNKLLFRDFYSLAQGRAKISYKTQDNDLIEDLSLPDEGTFHVDKAANVLLLSRNAHTGKSSCKLADKDTVERIAQTILFDESRQDLIASGGLPILGPAKVLFLLDKLKPQLKKVNEFGLKVRNVPAVMFKYINNEAGTDQRLQFYCLYAKSHLQSQSAMPFQISMSRPGGKDVLYEFLDFQIFDNSIQLVEAVESLSDSNTGVLLDPLAIERNIGCANIAFAEPSADNDPFQNSHETRFYFRARIALSSGKTKSVTVAYEGALDMMRVDGEGITMLLNMHLGHAYHVADRKSHQDATSSSLGRVLDLSDSWDRSRQEDPCILMKIPTRGETTKSASLYDIDRLLVGASGENFIYLGRARVRGVWTQVYEAYNTKWPVWLEQPVQFSRNWSHDDPKEQHIHDHSSDLLSTVIYLEEQLQAGDDQQSSALRSPGRLLLMEISRVQASDLSPLDSITIQMYDFSWKLVAHPADGSPISDYFSLSDRCLASTEAESNHYARADMLLASDKHETPETWRKLQQIPNSSRNLALLQSLHDELRLSPTIVYDLESALTVKQEEKGVAASLLASFRLARHRQVVSSLRYYGTGRPKKMFQFKLWRFPAGFSECFYLAAHHNQDTFFAHSGKDNLCLIDLNREPESVAKKTRFSKPTAFDLFTNGPMEIYFVHHTPDAPLIQADPISSLKSKSAVMHKCHITLLDSFSNATKRAERFDFHVKHLDLHELNEKHSFKVDDAFFSDANKFFDVAFVVDNSISKLVSTMSAEHEMNFATCQTACFCDSNCQSFSLCFVKSRYQCTLSRVNLEDSRVLLKLLDIRTNGDAKFGQTFQIHTEIPGSFNITKQRNCEMHAKTYLDLFHVPANTIKMPLLTTNLAHLIYKVDGREECARICYRQTYDLLEEDMATNLRIKFEDFLSPESTIDDEQEAEIKAVFSQHQRRLKSLCDQFLFLDASAFASLSSEIQELIKQSASYHHKSQLDDSPVNNYCFTVQPNLVGEKDESKLAKLDVFRQIDFEWFRFKFELLYERLHGVKMSKSSMSANELEAYAQVRLMQTFKTKESMEVMKNFLDRHENIQENIIMSEWDESKCALICTQQLKGIWPSCKSFDMLIIATGNLLNTICRLNSMTLRQAKAHNRSDLIEYGSSFAKVQIWHYEPRLGAVQEELELESQLELTGAILEQHHSNHAAAIFFVVSLALIVGLLSGIGFGQRILEANQSVTDESTDTRELVRDETFDMNTFRKTG